MLNKNSKFIISAEILAFAFLVLRGVLWFVDHSLSRHQLDNLTMVIALLFVVLFVLTRPNNKAEQAIQTTAALTISLLGIRTSNTTEHQLIAKNHFIIRLDMLE